MIRNVVIHILNEQPLLADLFDAPSASDVTVICTNLRTLNGKRPVFIDHIDSTFVLPLATIRFIEIPPGARGEVVPVNDAEAPEPAAAPSGEVEQELEIDEDFLRRVREA